MDLNLTGKTVVVVGGGAGVGRAICKVMAEEGAKVAVLDRHLDEAEETARMVQEKSGIAIAGRINLLDPDDVAAAFEKVVAGLGPVEIMVFGDSVKNNIAPISQMKVKDWDNEIAYTTTGAFHCVKQVIDSMKERGWGRFIFISSRAVSSGAYGQVGYVASMAGLLGLAKSVALEYARNGVTSNIVFPGLVDTPDYHALPEEVKERLLNKGLMKRLEEPEEIARTVSYLCSDYAKNITGAEINQTMGGELFVY